MQYTRRDLGRMALAALPAAALLRAAKKIDSKIDGVQIGVQSYSFRDRSLDEAIAAMKEIGLGECELYQGHVEGNKRGEELKQWRLSVPLDTFKAIRAKFDDAGIQLFAYNISFNDNFSNQEIDRGFQMAEALGVKVITASSTLTAAKRVAPFADKYKIKVAMHGHNNLTDPNQFAKPESFAKAMEMSKYFCVNLDIGHFWSAGYDPVPYIQEHHDRITNLHIKDRVRNDPTANKPFGQGNTPIKEVMQLLKTKKWPIPANIEYEYGTQGVDGVAEVKKCFQYLKDALA